MNAWSPALPALETPEGAELGVLAWRYDRSVAALSSAAVGGGFTSPTWVLNIRVPLKYARTDLHEHVDEVAAALRLTGSGIGLLTAADITRWRRAENEGVVVDATSGVSKPTWAADAAGGWTPWQPGTINIVAHLPLGLEHGAAVNAVMTITEAKSQALAELDIPGTGTASDAVTVLWPTDQSDPDDNNIMFMGPRSLWGSRLALATYDAVLATAGPSDRAEHGG